MKKLFFIYAILCFSFISLFSQAPSPDPLQVSKNLGLVGYLTHVKNMAEYKIATLAANPLYKTSLNKAASFNASYNMVKLSTDKLINQLSADLYAKNNLKFYKKINKYLKGTSKDLPENLKVYKTLIDEIDGQLIALEIKTYASTQGGPGVEEIVAIATLGNDIVAGARDFREKKIQSITGLLKEIRLKLLSDIIKPVDKKE
jgi:hypothetical protein